MESKQKRTALVTGGSSGIGRCTAVALSKAGYIVYEFSRRDVPVEGVKHMCVDVTDEASVQEAVGQILLERGSIEILVNCAGFGISGAVEFVMRVGAALLLPGLIGENGVLFAESCAWIGAAVLLFASWEVTASKMRKEMTI